MIITPTKLSNSVFYEITIIASKTDQKLNQELEWSNRDVTKKFLENENYPKDRYTNIMGVFQHEETIYQVSGIVFGVIDEAKEKKTQK